MAIFRQRVLKIQETFRKKQDNLRCVFIYKKPDTLFYVIFYGIFEIDGGGEEGGYTQKNHFALHFYMQKNNELSVTFLYTNALCVTFLYLKFIL